MSLRRVVITGAGAVSPFGLGVDKLMSALFDGRSGVVNLELQWAERIPELTCMIGAPLNEPLDERAIPRKYRKTMGRTAILSYYASLEAIRQAGLSEARLQSGRVGICFGSSTGSAGSITRFYDGLNSTDSIRKLSSGIFFQIMSHTTAANIAHAFNINGRVISPNCTCSTAAQAIGIGFESIRHGYQDVMLCGGADELDVLVNSSFDLIQAASNGYNDTPEESPRPFDRQRDGTVCGEGAGCLVLEAEDTALARQAKIFGEVIGFHTSSSGVHMAQPDAESISDCIRNAIDNSGLKPEKIDYINAHATGTTLGDISEASAISSVFGRRAVPISSLKGHLGHTLGASGALEFIATLGMLQYNRLIPTRNLVDPGEGCDNLNHVKPDERYQADIFMKNSFAFGGINTVILGRRYLNGQAGDSGETEENIR